MPYKSDKQRRYMHAQHPEIAARWDAEIRAKKKIKKARVMSDTEIRHRKKIQSISSQATGTLGLAALGGTLLATKKGNKAVTGAFRAIKRKPPDALAPEKLKQHTAPILATSAGIGGLSSYNFAAYTNAESRKRQQVKKNMDLDLAPTYGTEGFAKNWKPLAREYHPEKERMKRAEIYPKAAAGTSTALAAGAVGAGFSGHSQKWKAHWAQVENAMTGSKKAYKPAQKLSRLRYKQAAGLGAAALATAGGAKVLSHKKKSKDWEPYAKSATSAFGVLHD